MKSLVNIEPGAVATEELQKYLHNHLWKKLREFGVTPVKIHTLHAELCDLIMGQCKLNKKQCSCDIKILLQKGCQCNGV